MTEDRDAFLRGNKLPDTDVLKKMVVPQGKQGVHTKLKELGKLSSWPPIFRYFVFY